MCPHADLLLGSAVSLDTERRIVEVESEAGRFAVAYDALVAKTPLLRGNREYRYGDSNPGFRRERAAS